MRGGVALRAGAVLWALVLAGPAVAAGGAPLPAPDDPPPGHSLATQKPKTSTGAERPATVLSSGIPTPDAPVAAEAPRATQPESVTPTTSSTSAAATPVGVTPPPAAPRPATRAATPPVKRATVRSRQVPKERPRPKAATPTAVRQPHDAARLGLPLGRLVLADDPSAGTALLVAVALLLAACGAGSLTVGVTVRRIARSG